jgi:hypothetical protein
LLRFSPFPNCFLFEEFGHRFYHFGVVFDKATVEVGEAEERLNVAEVGRGRPLKDCVDFGFVHLDPILGDDHP